MLHISSITVLKISKNIFVIRLGMHSSDTGLIYFEDVRVPSNYIIGEEGLGFTYQMLQFQVSSILSNKHIVVLIYEM